MLPCTQIPPLRLGALQVYPFAALVAFGVVFAHWLAVRLSAGRGLRPEVTARLGLAMATAGFAGAWLFHLAYQTGGGIASFGGIFGGLAGAWLYGRRLPRILPYLDLFATVFPIGWIFGRAGCALVHDHLGRAGGWWFTTDCGAGPQYNLGLIELLYMLPVAVLLLRTRRSHLGLFLVLYGPFRILLDRLHQSPLILDQCAGAAATLLGLAILTLHSPHENRMPASTPRMRPAPMHLHPETRPRH